MFTVLYVSKRVNYHIVINVSLILCRHSCFGNLRWRISATCEKKEKKSYLGLIKAYAGDDSSYVGLNMISYVGLIISYVGDAKSDVELTKSHVCDNT